MANLFIWLLHNQQKIIMKKILLALSLLIAGITLHAQAQYEITTADEGKIFKGLITRESLEKEPSFRWWVANSKEYEVFPAAVTQLARTKDSVRFVVFMGTWCDDSRFIVPKFYKLLDAAAVGNEKVSLIGVDHEKKTLDNLSESLGITNVPTIIVMKGGKEVGRVIEYGKAGNFAQDLGEIIATIK